MMRKFVVYNSAGDILRTGICPEGAMDLQKADGQFVMEGVANDATQHVVEGKIVDKPPAENPVDERPQQLRDTRNELLQATDWSQLADAQLSSDQRNKYQAYRQALRDLPTHSKWPALDPTDWPTLE